jgi:hypothetical protein
MVHSVFLPVIMQGQQKPLPLGVQIEGRVAGREQWIVPNRQYQIAVKWRDVETTKGLLDWHVYDPDFQALAGQRVTVGIKVVPEWARLWAGYVGSPPKPECYHDLARFLLVLIDRYRPDAIELFNEPDVGRDEAKWAEEYFGAWCIGTGFSSGGTKYGQCLKAIYPIIHEAYPNVRVIACALIGAMPSSYQFYQGAMSAGMLCDAVSFHKYIGIGGNYDAAFEFAALIGAKVLSETSVTAKEDSELLKTEQADYLKYLLSNYRNTGIEVIQWYSLANNMWGCADLVRDSIPTPAYEVWKA